jgi:2-dehydropantoate 2-reductase
MTVGIVGAGALGCVYGGYLHRAGERVHLIDVWDDHVAAINGDGLAIESNGERETLTPDATTEPDDIGVVDVAFVLVKATQTRAAVRNARSVFGEETTVVTLQNGLKNVDILGELVDESHIVSGTTMVGATVLSPGTVRLYRTGETVIGGDEEHRVDEIVSLLERANLPVSTVADPRQAIWSKQLVNVAVKPTAALTGLPNGKLVASEAVRSLMDHLLSETLAVADEAGFSLPEDDPLGRVIDVCERTQDKRSSMLVDIQQERKTEIDHINGAVVEYGDRYGVATPYNDAVTTLVRARESSYLDEGQSG